MSMCKYLSVRTSVRTRIHRPLSDNGILYHLLSFENLLCRHCSEGEGLGPLGKFSSPETSRDPVFPSRTVGVITRQDLILLTLRSTPRAVLSAEFSPHWV